MLYSIDNGKIKVIINSFGAELTNITVNGKERLWQNENGAWNGHSPLLFPVCGHFDVVIDGVKYVMPPHGFARKKEFSLLEQNTEKIVFELRADEKTKENYPYSFAFRVIYSLRESVLSIRYEVENLDMKTLAFCTGGHESFSIEGDLSDYSLSFPCEERFIHYFHNVEGYMTGEKTDLGTGKTLKMPVEHHEDSFTVIFDGLKSRFVSLLNGKGDKVVTTYFPDFDRLLLWRPVGANAICIEPWSNLPDPDGGNGTEFTQKSGVFLVEPKRTKVIERKIEYFPNK